MKRQNSLTIYWDQNDNAVARVTRAGTPEEIEALTAAVSPSPRSAIQLALEILAQVKPIGNSGVTQGTRIGLLTADLYEAGVSHYVVDHICKDYRKNAESRFFPDHSAFYSNALKQMEALRKGLDAAISGPVEGFKAVPATTPARNTPEDPLFVKFGGKWPAWPAHVRRAFLEFVLNSPESVVMTLIGMYDLTHEQFTEEKEKLKNV